MVVRFAQPFGRKKLYNKKYFVLFMKKIFCILSVLTIVSPVFADDTPAPTTFIRTLPSGFDLPTYGEVYSTSTASAAYVQGAYDAMDYLKENRLNDSNAAANAAINGDVLHGTVDSTAANSGLPAKPFVGKVTASNGVVTVTNTEVSVPVGNYTTPTARAPIWVE